MKKLISAFAIVASMFKAAAFAGTWGVEGDYQYFNGNSNTGDSNAFSVIPSYTTGRMVYDAELQTARKTGDLVIYNSVEGRAMYVLPIGDKWSAKLRGGYGGTYVSSSFTQFYTVEPIVAYQVNDKWSVNGNYRWLAGFGSTSPTTNRWGAGVDYSLTNKDTIVTQVNYVNDTFDGVSFKAGYKHQF